MTIDLGFAHINIGNRVVGFIDVPGHEKFIKNMVAGATAIHAVLLVVAADDSVMPQTREHLNILRFLDVSEGMVVITKSDLVDEETRTIVRMDIEEAVAGTFLEGKPILEVSPITGLGMDEFKEALNDLCGKLEETKARGAFKYSIQRSFTRPGFGTVLTGVPCSGHAKVGDVIEIQPSGMKARIRKMQAYHEDVGEIFAGHCAAINISDLKKGEVQRGMVAGTPGFLSVGENIETEVEYYPLESIKPLKDFSDVTFHSFAAETPGKVGLIGGLKNIKSGERAFAQIRLIKPVVVWPGMKFIIRRLSPPETLGGGTVLGISRSKLKRTLASTVLHYQKRLDALSSTGNLVALRLAEDKNELVSMGELCKECGLLPFELRPVLSDLINNGTAIEPSKDSFVHSISVNQGVKDIFSGLQKCHKTTPFKTYHEKSSLRAFGPKNDTLFDLCISMLKEQGKIEESVGKYRVSGYSPPLDSRDRQNINRLLSWFLETPYETHTLHASAKHHRLEPDDLSRLFRILEESGEIYSLPDGVFLSKEDVNDAKNKILEFFEKNSSLKSAEFKGIIGAGRKVAFALLDYFEKTGVTYRKGNEHLLRKF